MKSPNIHREALKVLSINMEEEQFGDFNGDDSDHDLQNESMDTMSDMVQSMAANVYAEFEKLIGIYGDGIVEGLMPHLVQMLESWDKAIKEKQDTQLELDLTKEDNDQLLNQYEREKQLRKAADQVILIAPRLSLGYFGENICWPGHFSRG